MFQLFAQAGSGDENAKDKLTTIGLKFEENVKYAQDSIKNSEKIHDGIQLFDITNNNSADLITISNWAEKQPNIKVMIVKKTA